MRGEATRCCPKFELLKADFDLEGLTHPLVPATFPGQRLTKGDLLSCPVIDLKPRLWIVIRSRDFSA